MENFNLYLTQSKPDSSALNLEALDVILYRGQRFEPLNIYKGYKSYSKFIKASASEPKIYPRTNN